MSTKTTDVAWLDELSEFAQAKVEIDREGNIIVSPATDPHVFAASRLKEPLEQAKPHGSLLVMEGPRWSPLGPVGPSYVPDLSVVESTVLMPGRLDYRLVPPPFLVVEIVSPESGRRDRVEKTEAYYVGGAAAYWTVEVPALTSVAEVQLTLRRRGAQNWDTAGPLTGTVYVDFPFPVTIDLTTLAPPA